MKRNHLIALIGILVVATVSAWVFWPAGSADHSEEGHSEQEGAEETEGSEGALQISEEQIEASSIEIEAVQFGAATELVFPAECQRTD
jgi:cobalt-zinc-cadmium efflux system membrane fusion protein